MNLHDPLRWPFWKHMLWLLPGLFLKALIFLYFVHDSAGGELVGRWAGHTSDTWEYVDPVESLIAEGVLEPDHRMPGYTPLLLLLRQFLSAGASADAITLLQWFFACLATYGLALVVLMLGASWRWFLVTYFLLIWALFPARLELAVMTDSFCTSAIGLHVVLMLIHIKSGRKWCLPAAGLFLTWAIFLRPIYALLIPLDFGVLLLLSAVPWRDRLFRALLFALPWLVIDGAWVIRNYSVHHAFRPLTNGTYNAGYSASSYCALMQFVQAYGGNYNFWDPTSDMRWFGMRERRAPGQPPLVDAFRELPTYVYASDYNRDSLLLVRDVMTRLSDTTISKREEDSLTARAWKLTTRFRMSFVRDHPFQFHVSSKFRLLGHMVIHSGSSVIFSRPMAQLSWWEKGLKLCQSALYWFAILFGPLGAAWLLLRERRDLSMVLLSCTVLYGLLIHPMVMRLCEMRYLVPTFPLTIVVAVIAIWSWYQSRKKAIG
ncbi:MAG: hypothetical protein IPI55_15720 [Flavobacteriales bacterium]|nr:hypothetical protein [Flavobacteriales bacterium]